MGLFAFMYVCIYVCMYVCMMHVCIYVCQPRTRASIYAPGALPL